MMDVMRVDHSLKVTTTPGWPPSDSLMDDNVVEDEVEQAVAENTKANGQAVRTVLDQTEIIEQRDRGYAEYHGKPIVPFKRMVMNSVV